MSTPAKIITTIVAIALFLFCALDPTAIASATHAHPVELATAIMAATTTSEPGPRFGTIWAACKYAGVSRSSIYLEAGRTPGLLKKWKGRTLVDFRILDGILDALPPAAIKAAAPRVYRKSRRA
jgi:hypothetical protein